MEIKISEISLSDLRYIKDEFLLEINKINENEKVRMSQADIFCEDYKIDSYNEQRLAYLRPTRKAIVEELQNRLKQITIS